MPSKYEVTVSDIFMLRKGEQVGDLKIVIPSSCSLFLMSVADHLLPLPLFLCPHLHRITQKTFSPSFFPPTHNFIQHPALNSTSVFFSQSPQATEAREARRPTADLHFPSLPLSIHSLCLTLNSHHLLHLPFPSVPISFRLQRSSPPTSFPTQSVIPVTSTNSIS